MSSLARPSAANSATSVLRSPRCTWGDKTACKVSFRRICWTSWHAFTHTLRLMLSWQNRAGWILNDLPRWRTIRPHPMTTGPRRTPPAKAGGRSRLVRLQFSTFQRSVMHVTINRLGERMATMKGKRVLTSLYLDPPVYGALKKLSLESRIPTAVYLREAIADLLKKYGMKVPGGRKP
jgi:Ribbon-helix-helix domain